MKMQIGVEISFSVSWFFHLMLFPILIESGIYEVGQTYSYQIHSI